jgi:hypothetical protein
MFSFKVKAIYDVFSDPIFTFLLFFLTHMAHANIYAFQSAYHYREVHLLIYNMIYNNVWTNLEYSTYFK